MGDPQIFLSHAGDDHVLSVSIADQLRTHFASVGRPVVVFNTSEPEHRFEELETRIKASDLWTEKIAEWENDLLDYLRANIEGSLAYVLIVTPMSLAKNSRWIRFEMQVAREVAGRMRLFFIPCVVGASLRELPDEATFFQGVELVKSNGFNKLIDALGRVVLSPE